MGMSPFKAMGLLNAANKCYQACVKDGSIAKLQPLIPQIKEALNVAQAEWDKPHVQDFIKEVEKSGVLDDLKGAIDTPAKAVKFINVCEEGLKDSESVPMKFVQEHGLSTPETPHDVKDLTETHPAVTKFAKQIGELKNKG